QQSIVNSQWSMVNGETYKLLFYAHAALVVSGTATLETALFNVPQVVVYETGWHWLFKTLRKWLLKVKWVSLVNLIADREVVPEQVADTCTVEHIAAAFKPLLDENSAERKAQLAGYKEVMQRLGDKNAPETAAEIIVSSLWKSRK
ncbi:MAG: lipid-A-disaccharide synthase, partial [Bacteroidaceae bacterium]|nr:lipid-A-disaccharide synthase [Bacteroidaceae bacterium]